MPDSEQAVDHSRYQLVPRTIIFLRRGDSYLLIKGSPTKRLWSDRYNGVGGHLDRGEDVLSCALRELLEETGLEAALWLCGTVIVDAGHVGVALYVFSGEMTGGALRDSPEGISEWIPYDRIASLPAVQDLQPLVARIHRMHRGDAPFAARSFYDDDGSLQLVFES